jgi:hypothetical protein
MPVLRTWSPADSVLSVVAPLALGAAADGPSLVVDLDAGGAGFPGDSTLARLVDDGPRRSDLVPGRRGVAVLQNGGIAIDDAREVLDALVEGWPNVVLRLPARPVPSGGGVVPVFPLTPGHMFDVPRPAVYQRGPWAPPGDVDGLVLPRPGAGTLRALLEGRRPGWSSWLRAWRRVWSMQWP